MIRKFQIAGLVAALLVTLAGLAQAREHHDRDDRGNNYAYQAGYRNGFDLGQSDRSQGAQYNYNSDDYRDADRGYNPDAGNRDEYRQAYQDGYVAGYNDGFYGRNGRDQYQDQSSNQGNEEEEEEAHHHHHGDRDRGYQSAAQQIGYQDGITDGRNDALKRKKFKPEKHDAFKDGDHGYRHDYGDKGVYKQQYRQAYTEGYEDGYRGGPGGGR